MSLIFNFSFNYTKMKAKMIIWVQLVIIYTDIISPHKHTGHNILNTIKIT